MMYSFLFSLFLRKVHSSFSHLVLEMLALHDIKRRTSNINCFLSNEMYETPVLSPYF